MKGGWKFTAGAALGAVSAFLAATKASPGLRRKITALMRGPDAAVAPYDEAPAGARTMEQEPIASAPATPLAETVAPVGEAAATSVAPPVAAASSVAAAPPGQAVTETGPEIDDLRMRIEETRAAVREALERPFRIEEADVGVPEAEAEAETEAEEAEAQGPEQATEAVEPLEEEAEEAGALEEEAEEAGALEEDTAALHLTEAEAPVVVEPVEPGTVESVEEVEQETVEVAEPKAAEVLESETLAVVEPGAFEAVEETEPESVAAVEPGIAEHVEEVEPETLAAVEPAATEAAGETPEAAEPEIVQPADVVEPEAPEAAEPAAPEPASEAHAGFATKAPPPVPPRARGSEQDAATAAALELAALLGASGHPWGGRSKTAEAPADAAVVTPDAEEARTEPVPEAVTAADTETVAEPLQADAGGAPAPELGPTPSQEATAGEHYYSEIYDFGDEATVIETAGPQAAVAETGTVDVTVPVPQPEGRTEAAVPEPEPAVESEGAEPVGASFEVVDGGAQAAMAGTPALHVLPGGEPVREEGGEPVEEVAAPDVADADASGPAALDEAAVTAGPAADERVDVQAIPDKLAADLSLPVAAESLSGLEEATEAATPSADVNVDQAEMRRRIEETRARLKAKAFDAMASGEGALLANDEGGALDAKPHDLEADVEQALDRSLSQEDY